jgi:hypothetical protein
MKTSVIDPGQLLGFRVLLAEAMANGQELNLSDSRLGEKLSLKIGGKVGQVKTR